MDQGTSGGTIGGCLRELRLDRGLTMEQLAEKAGLSRDLIAKVEQGQRDSMRVVSVRKLAGALGAPIGELLGESTPQDIRDRLRGARVRELLTAHRVSPPELDAVLAAGVRVRRLLAGHGIPPDELDTVLTVAARLYTARAEVRALAEVVTHS